MKGNKELVGSARSNKDGRAAIFRVREGNVKLGECSSKIFSQTIRGDIPNVGRLSSRPAHNDAFTTAEGEKWHGVELDGCSWPPE